MNITHAERDCKLAIIQEGIALNRPFASVCETLRSGTGQLRDFLARHKIELPEAWKPRRYKSKKSAYVKSGQQSKAHTRASIQGRKTSIIGQSLTDDPSALTPEERKLADSLRIPYDRMAYLLKCPKEGNAAGWRGGAAIG